MQARIVNSEGLSPEQAALVQRYLDLSGAKGVRVGALIGEAAWDVRPLFLNQGTMTILRFFPPGLFSSRDAWAQAQRILAEAATEKSLALVFGEAEVEGRSRLLWYRRKFYSHVLAQASGQADEVRVRLADRTLWANLRQQLFTQYAAFAARGAVHGHICPSNVAFDGDRLVFFDHGVLLSAGPTGQSRNDVAPELSDRRAGSQRSVSTDIFGLGLVCRFMASIAGTLSHASALERWGTENPEQARLLDAMTSSLRQDRPMLNELITAFGTVPTVNSSSAPAASSSRGPVKSGKLINPRILQAPAPPPEPTAAPSVNPAALLFEQPYQQQKNAAAEVVRQEKPGRIVQRLDLLMPMPPAAPMEVQDQGSHDEEALERPQAHNSRPNFEEAGPVREKPQPKKKKQKKLEDEEESSTPKNSNHLPLAALVIILALVGYRLLRHTPLDTDKPYQKYWASGEKELMQEVAADAVEYEGDAARKVIIADALKGGNRPGVNAALLRYVFDAQWIKDLDTEDIQMAVKLSLLDLLELPREVPKLKDIHPVVIVAAVGSSPVDAGKGMFKDIPLDSMATFPKKSAGAFTDLAKLGVRDFDDPAARGLSHLIIGDTSQPAIDAYLADPEQKSQVIEKLRLLLRSVAPNIPELNEALFAHILTSDGPLKVRANWLGQKSIGGSDKLAVGYKLMLIAGVVPNEALSFEQYCELLLFPGEAAIAQSTKDFRAEIKQHIAATHPAGKKIESTLQFLSEKEHSFTRDQVVSLLVALGGEDEKHFGMMGFWFKNLKPDPDNVLRLLIARNNLDQSDYFNGEAAGYISAVRFSPSRLELRALATHKVSLARAFAYARLDTSIPEELDLLNKALAIEPDDDLRRDLQRKIALAKEMGR